MEKHINRNLKLNQSLYVYMNVRNIFIINNRNQKHNPNTEWVYTQPSSEKRTLQCGNYQHDYRMKYKFLGQ